MCILYLVFTNILLYSFKDLVSNNVTYACCQILLQL